MRPFFVIALSLLAVVAPFSQAQAQSIRDLFQQSLMASIEGNYAEAEALLRQVLALDPDDIADQVNARLNLGNVLRRQERYLEAEAYYLQARQLAPEDSLSAFSLGNLYKAQGRSYQSQGRYIEAEAIFRRSLAMGLPNPATQELAELYSEQALNHRREGRYAEAEAVLLQALELEVVYAFSYRDLGYLYQMQGQYEAAIAAYEQSLVLEPNNLDVNINLDETQRLLEESIPQE